MEEEDLSDSDSHTLTRSESRDEDEDQNDKDKWIYTKLDEKQRVEFLRLQEATRLGHTAKLCELAISEPQLDPGGGTMAELQANGEAYRMAREAWSAEHHKVLMDMSRAMRNFNPEAKRVIGFEKRRPARRHSL